MDDACPSVMPVSPAAPSAAEEGSDRAALLQESFKLSSLEECAWGPAGECQRGERDYDPSLLSEYHIALSCCLCPLNMASLP